MVLYPIKHFDHLLEAETAVHLFIILHMFIFSFVTGIGYVFCVVFE